MRPAGTILLMKYILPSISNCLPTELGAGPAFRSRTKESPTSNRPGLVPRV